MFFKPLQSVLILALLTTPIQQGCNRNANLTEHEHIQRAKDFEDKGNLKAGVIELKNAIQKNPDSAQARLLLGEIYLRLGKGDEAEKEFARTQKLGVNRESIKPQLGKALLLMGEYRRVLAEIQPSEQTSKANLARIYQMRGEALLKTGKLQEACNLFQQSQESDNGYVPAYRGLARCAVAQRNLDEAKAHLDAALRLDSKDADTWILLGEFETLRNNREAAEASFLNAKKVDASNVGAYLGLASLYVKEQELTKAEKELQGARKEAPDNLAVRYTQALLLFQKKKYTEARDELQGVLQAAPDHMPSVLLSGAVAYSLGSYEQAAKRASRFLGQFPDNVYARKLVTATLLKLNQPSQALDALKPALVGDTQDVNLLTLAAEAYLGTQDTAKAAEYFEKALKIAPKSAEVRTALGLTRLVAGESVQGMAELESATELDSRQNNADTLLILNYLNAREYDKALAAVSRLEKKLPNNPVASNFRGVAYAGKKDFANARKSFEQALALLPIYEAAASNLAQLDLQDGNPQAARQRFEAILAKDKNNVEAMLALASLAGNEAATVSWLEKAIKTRPSATRPKVTLAQYYLTQQKPRKALALALQLQQMNPSAPDILDLLGTTQWKSGENDNALATYTKLTTVTPNSPVAFYKLASVQAATTKGLDAAKSSLGKALALKPDYAQAQIALIALEIQTGEYLQALKVAKGIQQRYPGSSNGFVLEGNILKAQNKYAEAANAYENALRIGKNGQLAINVHQGWSLAGDAKKANAGLLQWLKAHPDELGARDYLAQSYRIAGRNDLAIEQYQFILQKSPNYLAALNNMAWLYQQNRDPRALTMAERAYKIQPDAPVIGDTLGWILVEQGQIARGVEVLKTAASSAPKNAEIVYHYAAALAKNGDGANSRKQLEKLLASGQEFPQKEEARALLKRL